MALSRSAKLVLALVSGLVLLILAIPATLLIINWSDEPLDPQIQIVLDRRHDGLAPAENLYFALLAFNSRDASDINAQGQRLYAQYLAAQSLHGAERNFRFNQDASLGRRDFVGDLRPLCGALRTQEDCLERVHADRAPLERLLATNRVLLERYESLLQYAHLQDPVRLTPTALIIQWQAFRTGKRLWLTDLALQIDAGKVDAGIGALEGEAAFTRRMLAEPDLLLIDKVILAASLRDDLRFISDLLRQVPLSDGQYEALNSLNPPLTAPERSLEPVLVREFTGFVDFVNTLGNMNRAPSSPGFADRLAEKFFKMHATANLKWSYVQKSIGASRGSCGQLPTGDPSLAGRPKLPFYDYAYNPVGKMLVTTSEGSAAEFLEAMCDLEGMRRIVVLQTKIKAARLTDAQIGDFLNSAGADLGNPYSAAPMEWRADTHALTFKPLASRDTAYFPWAI